MSCSPNYATLKYLSRIPYFVFVLVALADGFFEQVLVLQLGRTGGGDESPSSSRLRRDNADERGPFLEGDMIIPNYADASSSSSSSASSPQNTARSSSSSTRRINPRWENAQLVYTIDPTFTFEETRQISKAFADISNKTCVRFQEQSSERDFVFLQRGVPDSGCWSFVGRIGGKQIVNLEPPVCTRSGSISHELLHTLGRVHEQSRFDRDDYVSIDYSNVIPGLENNFRKYSREQLETFGLSYDYSSIMHYSAYAFALNPAKPTIVPRQSGVTIGQRLALSPGDAEKINRLYSCP